MKKILLTTTLLFISLILAFGQVDSERTLVKSFNWKGHDEVVLNFDGDVAVERRKSDIVRVQVTIGINNTSSILKSLITARRYNLKMTVGEDGKRVLSLPNLDKEMSIGGKKLKEKFSFVIQVPENVSVSYGDQAVLVLKPKLANTF